MDVSINIGEKNLKNKCVHKYFYITMRKDQKIFMTEDHDWDPDMGAGFYYVCRCCGELEWTE